MEIERAALVTIDVRTTTREETIDISALVHGAIRKRGVASGIVVVFCPHTTAGITLQENTDPTVKSDLARHLRKLVPQHERFEHAQENQDAHIKSSLVGTSISLVVDGGKPVLGTWQALFFCEFDGPRQRRVLVKVMSER